MAARFCAVGGRAGRWSRWCSLHSSATRLGLGGCRKAQEGGVDGLEGWEGDGCVVPTASMQLLLVRVERRAAMLQARRRGVSGAAAIHSRAARTSSPIQRARVDFVEEAGVVVAQRTRASSAVSMTLRKRSVLTKRLGLALACRVCEAVEDGRWLPTRSRLNCTSMRGRRPGSRSRLQLARAGSRR